ncbi:ribonuclease G [Granulicella rosea]|uniref:Ribonuclease G n=1 Tax=Granulicella rosea TaxID=474952 RepID=A0A239KLS1_9BACT|nr:Rne/Rng family ribonuclease [Granulicella rosea]SNT18672.1 ribonuclease G [Granulicella rosea]
MSKEIYISSTPHETRLAIVENDALTEIYYERENEYTLAGSIYNGKVTRVLPGMQSSFVDIGLERDAFLYITDFMEEAGDSADFEGASANGDGQRAARPEGAQNGNRDGGQQRRDRGGDRGGRPDRNQERGERPEKTQERTDAELFKAAVSDLDESAAPSRQNESGDRPERNDRGNRRGGRNRRDRGNRPDRTPEQQNRPEQLARPAAPAPFVPEETSFMPPPTRVDTDEVGEGAPGADGSRRWRGRRGRRGGRGPGREGFVPAAAAQPIAPEPVDLYAAEEPVAPPVIEAAAPETPRFERSERPERNDRGDRGPRRDRNQGGKGDRDQRSPRGFEPRSFAPAEPVYGQEVYAETPAEPIILPGESLGKYRKDASGAPAPEAATVVAAPVSTEFVLPGAWDGGAVLPGETIRPRRPEQSGQNPSRPQREQRPPREPREFREQASHQAPAPVSHFTAPVAEPETAPAVEPVSEPVYVPESAEAAVPAEVAIEAAAPFEPIAEPAAFEPEPVAEAAPEAVEAEAPIAEIPQEYEPTEASVSFKIDPVAPREYRQSAPVAEAEPVAETVAEIQADEQLVPVEFAPEPVAEVATEAHHDITSIQATGEMISEPVHETVEAAPVTHEVAEESAAPVIEEPVIEEQVVAEHFAEPETPVVELQETAVEEDEIFEEAVAQQIDAEGGVEIAAPYVPPVQHFAPGAGDLEEEEMEEFDESESDDDADLRIVHARSVAQALAEQQVETLEGAADLGTMLRDLSIDEETDEDEEDFEEDFLEEDQDHTLEEADDEPGVDDFDDAEAESYAADEAEGEEFSGEENDGAGAPVAEGATRPEGGRQEGRGRREGRNRGRREGRGDRSNAAPSQPQERSERSNGGGRDSGRRDHRGGGRQSMQSTNLPAISELLKPGQEILCQIAKEPIAKKGARITSHIALPGRFLVFMPTVSHTGVSRKIESDGERRRLKEILLSEKGEAAGGFIVRTAAAGASEEELRSDLRFLLNLWADIKTRSEASKSPALIYHDLNLIERILRDQVTDNFSAIWVDTETEYERVLRFLQRFQPSLIRRVKLYTKETPLFEQFGITEEINKALRSKVWLKSGGSIVINQTEALVAIDINTGKYVGKTARLEDTIVKTNLDAIPEIVRQIRLRDLGGIIIIDFIDMDERKNRNKVMAALEEELKSDRAPSKVLQFNDFGLVAITRKRVKQSLERTLSTTCGVCAGTGMVKSPITVCNDIYVEMRKMHKHLDRGDVMLRVHPEVVKQLKSPQTHWLQEMEEMCGKTILVKSDPSLHPEQFDIH